MYEIYVWIKRKMALRYVMLKNPNLESGCKWRHRMYPVSVYQLILIFLMAKNTVSHGDCSSTKVDNVIL